MNIALFLNKDIYANLTYHLLSKELEHHNIRIYYSETVGANKAKPQGLQVLEYLECDYPFQLLKSYLDSGIPAKFQLLEAASLQVPFEKCLHPNDPEFIKVMEKFGPDLILSVRYGRIFHQRLIDLPSFGVLNLHSAILPDYRGIMGTLHAIKNGDKEVGCTLHFISDSGIDTGSIIDIGRLRVDPTRSLFWHIAQLYPLGASMIIQVIGELSRNKKLSIPMSINTSGAYYSVPTDDDFSQLRLRGHEIISLDDYIDVISQWVSRGVGQGLINDHQLQDLILYVNSV